MWVQPLIIATPPLSGRWRSSSALKKVVRTDIVVAHRQSIGGPDKAPLTMLLMEVSPVTTSSWSRSTPRPHGCGRRWSPRCCRRRAPIGARFWSIPRKNPMNWKTAHHRRADSTASARVGGLSCGSVAEPRDGQPPVASPPSPSDARSSRQPTFYQMISLGSGGSDAPSFRRAGVRRGLRLSGNPYHRDRGCSAVQR